MTFVGEVLRGVEAGVEECIGLRGGDCFGVLLGAEPLGEPETVGWRQGVGLWDLLKDGPEGDGEDAGVSVWVGVGGRVRVV